MHPAWACLCLDQRKPLVRKHLFASLSACLVTASFVGCGDQTQEAKVSDQLDTLLDQMSRLQYADAPTKDNTLEYTRGKEVDGIKVPGSTRFEAAYLDQALALLSQANEIEANGTALQKQSANAIIGSIRMDEAAFLIDEAERSFQLGAKQVVDLRSKLAVLREIEALNRAVAGDRAEVIAAYRSGVEAGDYKIIGIDQMQEQAGSAAATVSKASQDLAKTIAKITDLREQVTEYEALELKLSGQARSAQSTEKFDKLDQATAAAKEAETAQAMAQKLEIDAWISERVEQLAAFRRQRLAGQPEVDGGQLLSKIDALIQEASQETNIPSSSDAYTGIQQRLNQAKEGSGSDTEKAAVFLLAMSDFGTGATADQDDRRRFVAAMDKHIIDQIGVIGALEMKVEQVKIERQRVASKLVEIENDRQKVQREFSETFAKHDAATQVTGFDRMAAAIEALKQAEVAVQGSGKGHEMDLMSVYMLHARALHQQSVSAQLYQTTLASIAAAGPELLGDDLHSAITARANDMQAMLDQAAAASGQLQEAASTPSASLLTIDAESERGQIASRQLEVYQSLVDSLDRVRASTPTADPEPAAE